MRRSKQNNWAFIFAFDSINQSNAHPKRLIPPFNLIKHQRQCCIHQIQYIFVCSIQSDQNSEQTSAVTPLSKAVFAEFGINSNWSCRTCQKSCIGSNRCCKQKHWMHYELKWIKLEYFGHWIGVGPIMSNRLDAATFIDGCKMKMQINKMESEYWVISSIYAYAAIV